MLSGYVYIDVAGCDLGRHVQDAKKLVRERLQFPAGYTLAWSGQYESMQRVRKRLKVLLPVTLFLLIYVNTRSAVKTLIILLAVPFSAVGAV